MDGKFDILFLGDGFKGNQASLFSKDVELAKAAIMRTAPFTGRTDIVFQAKNVKQNLGCDDSAIGQGNIQTIACNTSKIIANTPLPIPDLIIVIANGKGHASFDGDRIVTLGVGDHSRGPKCTFEQAAFDGKMMHEIGHYFGLEHENTVGSKMNSGTSGGCDIWMFGFTPEQQAVILAKLNSM